MKIVCRLYTWKKASDLVVILRIHCYWSVNGKFRTNFDMMSICNFAKFVLPGYLLRDLAYRRFYILPCVKNVFMQSLISIDLKIIEQ